MKDLKRITNWIDQILTEISEKNKDHAFDILYNCGLACAENSDLFKAALNLREKHSTEKDTDKLFHEYKSQFYNNDRLDKDGKKITLIFEECTCPLVKNGVSNSILCNCTMGYTKKIFETLFNKEVSVYLEQSILKGDPVCKQIIKIKE